MPSLATKFEWGKDLCGISKSEQWEKGLKSVIKEMDGDEFNLFLAQVVMAAASKQIMGVDLTEKIQFLKSLRG